MRRHSNIRFALFCTALLLCGCSKREALTHEIEAAADAKVTGIITAPGSQAPTSKAQLELRLSDVSAEGSAVDVAKLLIKAPEQFPSAYSLPYRSGLIQAGHRYTLSARILEGDRPQWATDTAYAVITQGNPMHIDVQLVAVGASSTGDATASESTNVTESELRDAAGVASYRAYFKDTELVRIEERGNSRQASYEFTGARLQRYSSTNEAGEEELQMEFDERGKLVRATQLKNGISTAARTDDVYAVRNRAALLRSHALAQREIQSHAFAH